ncbi:MAG: WHG domain-containing protein [Acidimicrobiia bacterium]
MSRRDDIIDVAGQLLERDGTEGLTMRAVAGELGIQAPSLYKHVANKRELEVALVTEALVQQADAFEEVVADSNDPVSGIAAAYRSWALEHPHLYALMNDQPLPRDELPEGLEERAVLPLLEALGGDMDRARAAWAFAHGMVTLELADRFPEHANLAAAWNVGLASITKRTAQPDHQGEPTA